MQTPPLAPVPAPPAAVPEGALREALRTRFGLEAFRPWQEDAVGAVLGAPGKALVVAPTGGGKSLTYQLPATLLEGTTIVLSPLVALMEDQVRALAARGVRATYLASTLEWEDVKDREARMLRGEYELVYLAPERLASERFVDLLARVPVALVAVDEAHCIAQWGHDFRPDYLRIGDLLERLRPPRVLACTATATPDVRREIAQALGFAPGTFREVLRGFARPNLHLAAASVDGPKEARERLVAELRDALGDPSAPAGAAIVYAATRKVTEETAAFLAARGFRAKAYHAGLDADVRSRVAEAFAARTLDVVVATNAFGMGIDRPDIRAVVHVQPPASIEAYYQEVGRAGRDGKEARGLLLCSGLDVSLRRRLCESGSDGPASPVLVQRAWAHFRALLQYLEARTCRHDFVLRYFGDEAETLGGCGHCDVCRAIEDGTLDDEAGSEETTLVVRKALSAVARADRRAGMTAVAEMLVGADTERTRRFGFTGLSTFGLLAERSQPWVLALLRSLLAAGWVDLTSNEHPVPYLTRAGAQVMKGEAPARLVLPAEPKKARARRPRRAADEDVTLTPDERACFERLRAHRAAVAKERGVPAYVVAQDKTLVELARKRPRTPTALLDVAGMGPSRVENYGDGFLQVLAED